MNAYAADEWAKIAQACDVGATSRRQLARQFRVSVTCIQKLLRRRRLTGRLAAAIDSGWYADERVARPAQAFPTVARSPAARAAPGAARPPFPEAATRRGAKTACKFLIPLSVITYSAGGAEGGVVAKLLPRP